jgi:type II secretory pathway component PulM
MKAGLRDAWLSRAPRERIVIVVLAAILGAASYLWLLHSAGRGREQLRASVAVLQAQSALLERRALEHERLRARPAPPASPTDLRSLVQARADAARLSGALTKLDATDADRVQIAFGAVRFADLLAWIAALEAQHVSLEAARIEALSAPGMVSATATLARSRAE